ncbi:hypothetical protein [Deinococcus soli (ex Cha et al. 2016)]|uniref:Uncharacterized protein n=2 Tax=Deinococcus soli (ex Cha et al. 2016) TaxID=1309411 RepID=A0ACC6KFR0_9DEIO|nr:hypothetical protein [Deinococcus soli (ex Cha et al. 2016)]MDR6218318.1 hypothetical protein [Deinococcus soli (ex Cha et al. 2016)]MDR6329058.1 hypothetical protein [Deinococcus soli (ex Cha et al. 2016)]MDR6751331.1 hypothetical protein [Deinococcus soli (ex Cha et al. 2016)]
MPMTRFGPSWGAPICQDLTTVEPPLGQPCAWCHDPISDGDGGLMIPHLPGGPRPYHWQCHTRQITGGANHIRGQCTCCGGTEPPDPPGVTRREAAILAVIAFEDRGFR